MSAIADATLREIRRRVFEARELTLDQAAADINVNDFAATIDELRDRMSSVIESLPDAAFTEQQAGEGEEVWTAGQIITHLSNSTRQMSGQVRPLLGMEQFGASELLPMEHLPARDEALTLLHRSSRELSSFLESVPRHADFSRTQEHARFGTMGPKGWLMLMAVHEEGHLRQLEALQQS